MLAAAYAKVGQVDDGLTLLTKALTLADKTEGRVAEAELWRQKGELTLQLFNAQSQRKFGV